VIVSLGVASSVGLFLQSKLQNAAKAISSVKPVTSVDDRHDSCLCLGGILGRGCRCFCAIAVIRQSEWSVVKAGIYLFDWQMTGLKTQTAAHCCTAV